MTEKEQAKSSEEERRAAIQVQTGDVEVAKLQLAARWAELASPLEDMNEWLSAFSRAFKAIDETMRA